MSGASRETLRRMNPGRETDMRYLTPAALRDRHVALVPLATEHAEELFHAVGGDEETWRYMPAPQPRGVEEMRAWIGRSLEEHSHGRRIPFAVIANEGGKVIGTTGYVNPVAANRHLDIGWTMYARSYWRSAVNTECKYLLLRRAFEEMRCIRVQFRVDARNERSRRAVERIGGVLEGVLRKAQLLHNGHERDVAIFSILDEEWPGRKAWFEERLAEVRS
jgi:RimJ/RimL family protein N-acetyltransferase